MNKRLYLWLLCIAAVTFSCKRELTSTSSKNKANKLDQQTFDFEYLKGKARVNYLEENERQNAKVNIRIKKDSVIWVQFAGVGGIEGGRLLITQDSLVMVDRINKEIYAYSYQDITDRYNFEIDFGLLQAMMVGNMPFPQENKDKVSRQSNYFLIRQRYETFNIENYVGRVTQKLEKLEIEQDITRNTLSLEYKDFNIVNDLLFPYNSSVTLKYNNNNKTLFTEISLEFSKAEIPEKPLKFPFSIPQKYVRK